MKAPVPISIPPGVVWQPTKNVKSSNWREVHLVRWRNNKLTPIGGWDKADYTATATPIRAIHKWTTNAGIQMVAFLCQGHIYVDKGDGILTNISPTVAMVQPAQSLIQGGYGDNLYSYGDYGTARPDKLNPNTIITPGYYVDNWGQNLVCMTGADGRLLMWDPTSAPGVKATPVSGAPVGNRGFLVMPQRHVILFGAAGVMNQYAWCDEEDITDWNYADPASKAGFQVVQPASPIIACCKSGNSALFFTENGKAHYIEYIGLPYIFAGDVFAAGCTPLSPMSITDSPAGCVWMATNGMWSYQNRNAVPVSCSVLTWVDESIDPNASRVNAFMSVLSKFSEIWWFFADTTSQTNNRYVVWNYVDNWWSTGYLTRSAGANSTYTGFPLFAENTLVYTHENGNFYPGDIPLPYALSFPITVEMGSLLGTFVDMLPDYTGATDAVSFQLQYNIPRAGTPNYSMESDERLIESDGWVKFRQTGRDFRLVVRQTVDGALPWTLGDSVGNIIPRGNK